MLRLLFVFSLLSAVVGCVSAQDEVLVPGNPPLTRTMVDHRIWVLENFLDIHLTPEQKGQFSRALQDRWRKGDKDIIKYTLNDLKLYGKDAELRSVRASNQEAYVDRMRRDRDDPLNAVLLAAFDAEHPERRDVMTARGLGDLVGKWERGDALSAQRNPITGMQLGASFSDVIMLSIFSDGRFQHSWSHFHCDSGRCCSDIGTIAAGTVDVGGSNLTLASDSGQLFSKNQCIAAANKSEPMPPRKETFTYSLRTDARTQKPLLCLSGHPFQFVEKQPSQPLCYTKQEH